MKRTLENCSLIQRCVKRGVGEPRQFKDINQCEGYARNEHDDEPCDICQKCKMCTMYGVE